MNNIITAILCFFLGTCAGMHLVGLKVLSIPDEPRWMSVAVLFVAVIILVVIDLRNQKRIGNDL
jgi:hypothetical protein